MRISDWSSDVCASDLLTLQTDHGKNSNAVAQRSRIDHGVVGLDRAAIFQRTHTAQARGGGHSDFLCQFNIGHPAIVLQLGQDLPIYLINVGSSHETTKTFSVDRKRTRLNSSH